jgi:hypothetical protein
MAVPIPRYILPHSATQKYGTSTEAESGAVTWPSSRALSYVRFDPSSKLVLSKENQQVQLSAIMFFDCRNSLPAGATFAIGDQISVGSRTYTVVGGDEPIWDARHAHHYEVELE